MKSHIRARKETALRLLIEQLTAGTKPVKGEKPLQRDENGQIMYKTRKLKDGTFENILDQAGQPIPLRLDTIPLTTSDKALKNIQVANLKRKLGIQ